MVKLSELMDYLRRFDPNLDVFIRIGDDCDCCYFCLTPKYIHLTTVVDNTTLNDDEIEGLVFGSDDYGTI